MAISFIELYEYDVVAMVSVIKLDGAKSSRANRGIATTPL